MKAEEVRAFIDSGFQTPELAKEAGLVDDLQYRTDFIRIVRDHYGEDAEFDRSYYLPNLSGPEMDSMFDVFSLLFSSGKSKRFRKDYVAVVVLDDAITDYSIALMGRDPERARLAAVADAHWQNPSTRPAIEAQIIAPVRQQSRGSSNGAGAVKLPRRRWISLRWCGAMIEVRDPMSSDEAGLADSGG